MVLIRSLAFVFSHGKQRTLMTNKDGADGALGGSLYLTGNISDSSQRLPRPQETVHLSTAGADGGERKLGHNGKVAQTSKHYSKRDTKPNT